ncbi:MAG: hypothetical protein AAGG81_03860 [Chlamydiota bacterium]
MGRSIRQFVTLITVFTVPLSSIIASTIEGQPGVGTKEGTFEKIIQKSNKSSSKVNGKEVNYCLWYNPNNWELLKENLNDVAEYSFKLSNGDAYAMIIPEKEITPIQEAPYIIFEGAKLSGVENIKILKMENHLVNGIEVLYLTWSGEIMNTKFTYMYNIYSGKNGTVQVVAYTLDDLLNEKQEEMENLLNGFCIHEKNLY